MILKEEVALHKCALHLWMFFVQHICKKSNIRCAAGVTLNSLTYEKSMGFNSEPV